MTSFWDCLRLIRDVYRLPLYRDTRGIGNLSRVDLAEQSWIDGRVAMLTSHDDESIVVKSLCFQLADNGAE